MKTKFFRKRIFLPALIAVFTIAVFAGDEISPAEAIAKLQVGNMRYVYGTNKKKDFSADRRANAKSQHPYAIILTCADSRVSPEIVFDETLGRLFVVRNAETS